MNNKGFVYIDLILCIFIFITISILIYSGINNYYIVMKNYKAILEDIKMLEIVANDRDNIDMVLNKKYTLEIKTLTDNEYYKEEKIKLYKQGSLRGEINKVQIK